MNSFRSAVVALALLALLQACSCGGGAVAPNTDAGGGADASQTVDAAGNDLRLSNVAPEAQGQSLSTNEDQTLAITLEGSDADGDSLTYAITNAPLHGNLTGTSPDLTYTPDADYNGSDGLSYYVDDGLARSSVVTIAIEVRPQPDAPVANSQNLATDEDSSLALELTASDADGDRLDFRVVAPPLNGSLSGTAPHLVYLPDQDFNGNDSFSFTASDGDLDSSRATISIHVVPVNDAPVAQSDSLAILEDTALTLVLQATDVDADNLTYVVLVEPQHGSLSGTAPALVYTPNLDYMGNDSLVFKANDGRRDSNLATVHITVQPSPDRPTANAQALQTDEDVALAITLSGSDPENDPLTYTIVTPPSHGSISGTPPGVTYTPAADFHGRDDFGFVVNDGALDSATALVSVDVLPVQDPPLAVADSYTIDEDSLLSVDASVGLLANDVDVDGDVLQASVLVAPDRGVLQLSTDGSFTFDPRGAFDPLSPGESTTLTFTYRVSDSINTPSPATVTLTVQGRNDDPVVADESYAMDEDSVLTVAASSGVLANDSDVEGDALAVTVVTGPAQGRLSLALDGGFRYDPAGAFESLGVGESQQVSFTYRVDDGQGGAEVRGTATITVNGVNDAPLAVDDSFSLDEDNPLVVGAAAGLLVNDSDVDGDSLTAALVSMSAQGLLSVGGDGGFRFDPDGKYENLALGASTQISFTYEASDAHGGTAEAVAVLTINGRNDAPVGQADAFVTDEDTPLTILPAAGVLANDSDVDGDPLTVSLVSQTSLGVLSLGVDGSFTFDPNGDFELLRVGESQQVSFTYKLHDTHGATDQVSATITVNGVNDSPTANADSYSTIGNTAVVIDAASGLLINDSDIETSRAGLQTIAATQSSSKGGDVRIGIDGSFTYTPPVGVRAQSDSFTYTLDDGDGGRVDGTVTITIGADLVWYVDNQGSAPGDGRSTTPFVRLQAVEGPSLDGDTIWVRRGDGSSGGYDEGVVLKANQSLLGQGVDLIINSAVIEAASQRTLVANTAGHAITLADGVHIEGLDIDFASGDGLHGSGLSQAMTVGDIRIANTDGHGLWLHDSSADLSMGAVSIVGTGAAGSLGNGIDLFSNTSVLSLASLSIVTDNGGGLVTFGGGSVDIAVATTSINATGGPAVDIGNTPGWVAGARGWQFANLSSTNSASWGLRIVNQIGAGSFTLSGTLSVVNPQSEALFVGTVGTPVDLATVALQAPSGYGVYATSASDLRIGAGTISNVAGSSSAGGIHLMNSTVDLKLSSVSVGAAAEGLYASGGGGSVVIDSFIYSGGLGRAVDLVNSNLALTLTAGSIATPAGGAIYVSGGAPTLDVATDISVNAGYLLSVADTSAGSSVTVLNGSFTVTGGAGVQVSKALGSLRLGLAYYSGVSNSAGAVVDISGTCGALDFSDLQIDTSLNKAVQARGFGGSLSLRGAMLRATQRTVDVTFTGGGSLLVSGTVSRRFGAEAVSVLLDTGSPVSFDLVNNVIGPTSLQTAKAGIVLRTGAGAAGEFRGSIAGNDMSFLGEAVKVISDGADVVITDPLLSNTYETNGVPPVVLRGVNGGRVSLDADLSTTALDPIVYDSLSIGTDIATRATVLPFEYQDIAGTLHFTTSLAAYTDGIPALQIDGISAAELTLRSDTGVFDTTGAVGLVISDANLDLVLSSLAVDGNSVAATSLQLARITGKISVNDVVDLSNTTGACLDVSNAGANIDLAYTSNGSVRITGCGGPAVELSGNSKASTILGLGVSSLDSASLPILRLANNTAGTVQTGGVTLANPGNLNGAQVQIFCDAGTPGIDTAASYQFAALRLTHAINGGLRITDSNASTTFAQLQITATGGNALYATSGGSSNVITVPAGGGSFINSTNGTAIYVSGANMDMHVQSVTASNSAQGIFFWMGGLLEVTGDAAGNAGSGGSISVMSQDGVSASNAALTLRHMTFIDTAGINGSGCQDPLAGSVLGCHAAIHLANGSNPVFDDLLIDGSNQDGIVLDDVFGSTLSNISIQGVGDAVHEVAIALVNCANTHSLSNVTVGVGSGAGQFNQRNLVVSQQSRNNLTLNVTNSSFDFATGDSVLLRTASTHQITASFNGGGMNSNGGSSLAVETYNTSSATVSLANLAVVDNNGTPSLDAGVQGRNYDDSSLTMTVDQSTFSSEYTGRLFSATQPLASGTEAPQLRVTLTNNIFTTAGTVTNPSGTAVEILGDNTGRVWDLVDNNAIWYTWRSDSAIYVGADSHSQVDSTIQNNSVTFDNTAWRGLYLSSFGTSSFCLDLGNAAFPANQQIIESTGFGNEAVYIEQKSSTPFTLDNFSGFGGALFSDVNNWVDSRNSSSWTRIDAGLSLLFVSGTCALP